MKYRQITQEERYTIARCREKKMPARKIAELLGRHHSTIHREVERNKCNDGGYRCTKAQLKTNGRRKRSRRNHRFSDSDLRLVRRFIKRKFSPEQISGTLARFGLLSISHETIYRYIWHDKKKGGNLYKHLRGAQKQRRKRYRSYDSRGRLAGKRHITERPVSANNRTRFGHWEVDTVMGSGDLHCIFTMVERRSGYLLIGKLKRRTKDELNKRAIALIRDQCRPVRTITADNGTEFHGYKDIEAATGAFFYFATPYHSWERGSNENTNGLIRQYLPKGRSMAHITQKDCDRIAHLLNTRPRKRHGFRTPKERYEVH